MRKFNGSSDELTGTFSALSLNPPAFTVSIWYRAVAATAASTGRLFGVGDGTDHIIVQHQGSDVLVVLAGGNLGDFTGNGIAVPDASTVHHYAWRCKGDGAEWSAWLDGDKTIIDAAISSGAFGSISAHCYVGHFASANRSNGYIGEIALFPYALTDDKMAELAWGVAADRFGAALYLPIRGNSSPEFNYVTPSQTLTVTGTTATAHIDVVPPLNAGSAEPVWVLDVYDADDQTELFRCASQDLYEQTDVDVLGAAYDSGILNADSLRVSRNVPRGGGVVTFGETSIVVAPDFVTGFDATFDFRGAGVRLRKYDRVSHALKTAHSGVVTGTPLQGIDSFEFPCSGSHPELQELIPRLTIGAELEAGREEFKLNSDDTVRPADLGAPIPIPCGSGGLVTPPYLHLIDDESPGGSRFLLGWGTDIHVDAGYGDTDTNTPGLERLVEWEDVSGAGEFDHDPTRVTSSTFTVNGSTLDDWYKPGMPLRFLDGPGGEVVARTKVASYSGSTVTTADAVVPDTIANLQIITEFIIEDDKWVFNGEGGETFMTTILHPLEPNFVPVYTVTTVSRQGPAQLISEILSDPDWGLGQSVNGDDILDAIDQLNTAGLSGAVRGVLGGDRLRRTAEEILNELCAWYGMQIWKDDQGIYRLTVDQPPTMPAVRFELGEATVQNMHSIPQWWYTPLNEAVSTIRHRYGKGGRVRRGTSLEEGDYLFANTMTVIGKGQRLEIVSDFLRNHTEAERVTYYIGQRLIRSDHHGRFTAGHDAWRLTPGRTLIDALVPLQGIDAQYRVASMSETLTSYDVEVEGPYNADIFTFDTNDVAQPDGTGNPDERPQSPTDGANLIKHSDFSTGLKAEPGDWVGTNVDAIPGWLLGADTGQVTDTVITRDTDATGSSYLSVTTGVTVEGAETFPELATPYHETSSTDLGVAVIPESIYVFSFYHNSDIASGSGDGLRVLFRFTPTTGRLAVPIRVVPGDVNAKGWRRFYAIARAATTDTYLRCILQLCANATTYNFDAIKLERLARNVARPTPWNRNAAFGLMPAQMQAGDQHVTATGQVSGGTTLAHDDSGIKNLDNGAASVLLMSVGAGDLKNLTGIVTGTITGCHHWQIRADSASGQILADDLPLTNGDTITSAHRRFSGYYTRAAAFNVYAVAVDEDGNAATFTGTSGAAGKVRILSHRDSYVPPTR